MMWLSGAPGLNIMKSVWSYTKQPKLSKMLWKNNLQNTLQSNKLVDVLTWGIRTVVKSKPDAA